MYGLVASAGDEHGVVRCGMVDRRAEASAITAMSRPRADLRQDPYLCRCAAAAAIAPG